MEYKISFSDLDAYYYKLIKVIDDKNKIIRHGNTERFVDIIKGKWVIICTNNNRIINELNPHIEKELENVQIKDWRLDGYSYLYDEYKDISIRSDYGIYIIDFESGDLKRIMLGGEGVCPTCGRYIKKNYIYGKVCRECLTKHNGLAYRYGYHDYCDGYPIYETCDKDKTPLFGCEIERDYNSNNGEFAENMTEAMLDIVKIFNKNELKTGVLKRENVFMYDGSLSSGGIEWITFPHTFNWYIKNKNKFDEALDKIKNRGFCATNKAGNHIHISRDYFGNDAEFCAAKMSILFNTYWKEFLAIAGREEYRTDYCTKPTQNKNDSMFNVVKKTIDNTNNHSVSVNLQHSKTIEVRIWSAINNADDLLFYLDNMQAMAYYVKKNSLEKVQVAKLTDYMKYFKLKSSVKIVKERLNGRDFTKYDTILNQMIGE